MIIVGNNRSLSLSHTFGRDDKRMHQII